MIENKILHDNPRKFNIFKIFRKYEKKNTIQCAFKGTVLCLNVNNGLY